MALAGAVMVGRDEVKREMGRRLARALAEAEVSPAEVAARLGYTESAVCAWMRGENTIPSVVLGELARL